MYTNIETIFMTIEKAKGSTHSMMSSIFRDFVGTIVDHVLGDGCELIELLHVDYCKVINIHVPMCESTIVNFYIMLLYK